MAFVLRRLWVLIFGAISFIALDVLFLWYVLPPNSPPIYPLFIGGMIGLAFLLPFLPPLHKLYLRTLSPLYTLGKDTRALYKQTLLNQQFSKQFLSQFATGPYLTTLVRIFSSFNSPLDVQPLRPKNPYNNDALDYYHQRLLALQQQYHTAQEQRATLSKTFAAIARSFEKEIKKYASAGVGDELGTIQFTDVANVPHLVQVIKDSFFTPEMLATDYLETLRHQFNINRQDTTFRLSKGKSQNQGNVEPEDYPGTPREVIQNYLNETPFKELFNFTLSYRLDPEFRFNHTHLVAASGHGKSQTLQRMIVQDADIPKIIIDPHNSMLKKLAHLRTFKDRLVIVDAEDDPGLNLFDTNMQKYTNASDKVKQRVVRSVIETSAYFFSSLSDNEFSGKMRYFYANLAYLMMYIPGATPQTLLDVLEKGPPADILEKLPANIKKFVADLLKKNSNHAETAEGINWRIKDLLLDPAFSQMFSASRNMVDMDDILATGKTLLVGGKGLSKRQSAILGRLFISKTFQAAMNREEFTPVYLYVDEAHFFLDKSITEIIDEARKFGLGLILAHQRLDQASPELKSALNTAAFKFAGGDETGNMAPAMYTTPQFLTSMGSRPPKEADWALYDRKHHKKAVKVTIPFMTAEKLPQLSEPEYEQLRRENRERLRAPATAPPPPPIIEADINIGSGSR